MPAFLTVASVMTCPHGGPVQAIAGNSRALASGAAILRAGDNFIVGGCPFVIAEVPSPCVTVQWSSPAQRNQVGAPVLTQASTGLCLAATQAPQGTVIISATQPRVQGG